MNLNYIQGIAAECSLCSLYKNRKMPVFARGSGKSGIMIIGMVPGPEENEVGIPFVGPAGKLLEIILNSIDIPSNDVYITNTVKCALSPGIPLKEEWITSCIPFLISQIYLIRPNVIITLGADATNALLGLPLDTKIGDFRGKASKYMDQIYVVPTYHPSYLLRGGGQRHKHYSTVIKDFSFALEISETERAHNGGL
jgi:DNA polymerase